MLFGSPETAPNHLQKVINKILPESMIGLNTPKEEKDQIAKDLLEYCALDTMAMVKIYEFLKQL